MTQTTPDEIEPGDAIVFPAGDSYAVETVDGETIELSGISGGAFETLTVARDELRGHGTIYPDGPDVVDDLEDLDESGRYRYVGTDVVFDVDLDFVDADDPIVGYDYPDGYYADVPVSNVREQIAANRIVVEQADESPDGLERVHDYIDRKTGSDDSNDPEIETDGGLERIEVHGGEPTGEAPVYVHRDESGDDAVSDFVFCSFDDHEVDIFHVPEAWSTTEWVESQVMGKYDGDDDRLDELIPSESDREEAGADPIEVGRIYVDERLTNVVALELYEDPFDEPEIATDGGHDHIRVGDTIRVENGDDDPVVGEVVEVATEWGRSGYTLEDADGMRHGVFWEQTGRDFEIVESRELATDGGFDVDPDADTFERSAVIERERGRRAAASARGDALGALEADGERMVIKTQNKRGDDDVYHTDPDCRYVRNATTDREVPLASIEDSREKCSVCPEIEGHD